MRNYEQHTRITMIPQRSETHDIETYYVRLEITPEIGPAYQYELQVATMDGAEEAILRTLQQARHDREEIGEPSLEDYKVVEASRTGSYVSTIRRPGGIEIPCSKEAARIALT